MFVHLVLYRKLKTFYSNFLIFTNKFRLCVLISPLSISVHVFLRKNSFIIFYFIFSNSGLAEWYEPNGGMFLWLKIIGIDDTKLLVTSRCLEKFVILAPGYALAVDVDKPSPYIRVSYSMASPEEADRVSKV